MYDSFKIFGKVLFRLKVHYSAALQALSLILEKDNTLKLLNTIDFSNMFDALSKAYLDVKEKDEEKLQRRKTKRLSKVSDDADNASRLSYLQRIESQAAFDVTSLRPRSTGSDDIEEDDDDLLEDRPKWDNDYVVLVFMLGYAAGLSNVWRFGYLCKTHGGVVFLIPYIVLTTVCAFPCLYLEMLVGQYSQVGAIASWKLCPLFKGVGLCMVLLAFMACFNIQSVLAWCLFYMFQSAFHTPLPWISCDNGFGKLKSGQRDESKESWFPEEDDHEATNWHTVNCTEFFADAGTAGSLESNQRLPGSEFFRGRVQRMWKSRYADSDIEKNFSADNGVIMFGLDSKEVGGILEYNADTLICLIVVFIIIDIIVAKGIKLNAKALLIIILAPYIIILLLFYRATGLRGAWQGLGELFEPDISQLFSTKTWWICAEQVFYSTGAGYGVHLTAASHNAFNRKLVYDAIFVVVANSATSLISACTIFMFLGHVKVALNKDLLVFVRAGPQLVFEVMSDILGVLPKANFYAFCFYSFLFVLALTTVTASLICAKISYLEVLPVSVKYKSGARMLLVAVIYSASFIVSSLNLTRGGLHSYNFITIYVGLYSLVLCAFLFLIGIAWFYGIRELTEATKAMGIRCPGIYYQICWKFVSPICIAAVFFGIALDQRSHIIVFDGREIELGIGLTIVGYIIGLGPFLAVLGGAFHALWVAPGKNFKEKLLITISPSTEHPKILATGTGQRAKWSHYFYLYKPTEGAKYNICCAYHGHSKVAPEETGPTDTAKVDGDSTTAENKQNSDPNGSKSKEGNDPQQGPSPKAPQVVVESQPQTEQKPEGKANNQRNSVSKEKRASKGSQKDPKDKKPGCHVQ